MLRDKLIHAPRVGFHHLAGFGVQERGVALSGASKSVGAELFVDGKRSGTQNLRKLPAGDAAEQVHLPETILRHDVALRLGQIFY